MTTTPEIGPPLTAWLTGTEAKLIHNQGPDWGPWVAVRRTREADGWISAVLDTEPAQYRLWVGGPWCWTSPVYLDRLWPVFTPRHREATAVRHVPTWQEIDASDFGAARRARMVRQARPMMRRGLPPHMALYRAPEWARTDPRIVGALEPAQQ